MPEQPQILHVKPDQGRWLITMEGMRQPVAAYGSKEEALKRGIEIAMREAAARLVLHKSDGSVEREHLYGRAATL